MPKLVLDEAELPKLFLFPTYAAWEVISIVQNISTSNTWKDSPADPRCGDAVVASLHKLLILKEATMC